MTGQFAAIRVLACGCSFDTGSTMLLFRTKKGELTECPYGHGKQKTKEVRSGNPRSSIDWFAKVLQK